MADSDSNRVPPPGKWESRDDLTTKISWYVMVFILGWMASTGYYRVEHLWAEIGAERHTIVQTPSSK